MSPPQVMLGPPPLPPGWSEHLGPGGQAYYYNAHTQESTYVRPIPAFPIMPIAQPELAKQKEKPLSKTTIPGTDWLRVKTTAGNTFYSHKGTKKSLWTVPDEIKDAVQKLEEQERQPKGQISDAGNELEKEVERVKEEVQSMIKRKAEEVTPVDEAVVSKKAKVEEVHDSDNEDSDESEEEEWQREAAAQLEAEAEAEKIRLEQEEQARKEAEEEAKKVQAAALVPDRVDLSLEEGKALFKTLLREKDINPLHPWDLSLPKFVNDPRYVLLPSVAARREAFDEYCKERARELRQSTVQQEKEALDPKQEFEKLLSDEVQSTRTSWTDFRRKWKKDRRFYGCGKDDRDREKRFRDFIKELGEKKRNMAEKAEADFFALLREKGDVRQGLAWKDIKRKLYDDSRYDAVGSASLREELFNTFLKSNHSMTPSNPQEQPALNENGGDQVEVDEAERQRLQKERKERAVREREQKVKAEREKLDVDIGKSRMEIYREGGERDFMTLLTDAIRDPQISWDAALPQLKTDPRFRNSPLHANQQFRLFHDHVRRLRSKHISNLYALFEAQSPSIATAFVELPLDSLHASLPMTKLGYSTQDLRSEFDRWQRERTQVARKAFDEMLHENSFVEFWGRLGKIGGEGVDGGVKAEETEGDEGEGGGGKVDMKELAKNVDVSDMEKVLKNDKRYIMFDHVPEQRERWIRDYLSNLTAPKLSVHVP